MEIDAASYFLVTGKITSSSRQKRKSYEHFFKQIGGKGFAAFKQKNDVSARFRRPSCRSAAATEKKYARFCTPTLEQSTEWRQKRYRDRALNSSRFSPLFHTKYKT